MNRRQKAVVWLARKTNIEASTFVKLSQGNFLPSWISLKSNEDFEKAYTFNPVVNAVVNLKAWAEANVIYKVLDLKTNEYFLPDTKNKGAQNLMRVLRKPNPLQTTYEWTLHSSVYFNVFGNNLIYGNAPDSYELNVENIMTLQNLPTQVMKVHLTGKWVDQLEIGDIIEKYTMKMRTKKGTEDREFNPSEILLLNDINITTQAPGIVGKSKLLALKQPITNIQMSLEARNVLMKRRGALGIFSSERKDATGVYPIDSDDKKEVLDDMQDYGTLDSQNPFIVTRFPLKFQRTGMNVKDLGLFEELSSDTIMICNSFGVPELLAKNYLLGGTYANLDSSEKRLYNGIVIPEQNNRTRGLNDFLKCEEFGMRIESSFDHVAVLQGDEKEKSIAERQRSSYLKEQFLLGAITYNEWRQALGQPAESWGDVRIFELSDREITIILGKMETVTEAQIAE